MATYKVIQDIEAEDKLLGPLSLRQFIYAAIAIAALFIGFQIGKAAHAMWIILPFLPVTGLFGMLAAPFGHDQSPEVWLLAKIRFMLKPRARIWDQNGMKQLVTINVPKKVEVRLTNGLNQEEVASRLQALAHTLDSRGWAVKNANVNLVSPSDYATQPDSDRLVAPTNIPQDVPTLDIGAADDILDATSNTTAQRLDQMIGASAQNHKQAVLEKIHSPLADQHLPSQDNPWFMEPAKATKSVVKKAKEAKDKIKSTVKLKDGKDKKSGAKTPQVDPVILELANRDDYNLDTLSRQAQIGQSQSTDGEIVVPLR